MSKRKFAFTLAEVLITVGIIGVISALVIPTLIQNQDMTISRNKFKKTIATLSEAGKLTKAQYGFDYADITRTGGANDFPKDGSTATFMSLINSSIKGARYLGYVRQQASTGYALVGEGEIKNLLSAEHTLIQLQDGTFLGIALTRDSLDQNCHVEIGETLNEEWIKNHMGCTGFIDVNGVDKPNKFVNCSDGQAVSLSPDKPCTVKIYYRHLSNRIS